MAKKMVINCANCDARKVTEETLQKYESIMMNCALVLVNARSWELLNRYPVTMNCANVLEVEDDVRVCNINGSTTLKAEDSIGDKRYYLVNGSLNIESLSDEMIGNIVGMHINGSVTLPESLSGKIPMTVNGSTNCYPDGAILLKRSAVIDKLFALRAKQSLYWSGKRMIMVDPQLDGAKLAAKGVFFSAPEVILAESKVEELIGLIDEKADIIIVPDGTCVTLDDVELDDMAVKKYGNKLYIIGDVDATGACESALDALEYLNVRGDVKVRGDLKQKLMEKLTEIDGNVIVPKPRKGRVISDKMSIRISKWMLEQEPEGIHVTDCMTVKIDGDIPKELILERLSISDVMTVKCEPDYEDVLAAVCEDVLTIGRESEESGVGSMVKEALGGIGDLMNTKMINAADYVM